MLSPRWIAAALALLCLPAVPASASAQQNQAQAPSALPESPKPTPKSSGNEFHHRFWDRENDWLFTGVAGARALDYFSTLNMRRRGRQEILLSNSIVDNHPLFGGIEASGVALSLGASYAFHRTGHHKIERYISIVHIGVGAGGAIRNYSLKTAHHTP